MVKSIYSYSVCSALLCALLFSPVAGAAPVAPVAVEVAATASIINKAGRQRMLSQRMVKAYCQVHLEVKKAAAQKILQDSVDLFDIQLIELKGFTKKPALQQAWAAEDEVWQKMRPVMLAPATHEGAKKLHELNEQVLGAAQKLTLLLEAESTKKSEHWVEVAGRQRMLSQRMAKFFMLRKMGINTPELVSGLEKAKTEFVTAHEALVVAAQNNPHIISELRLAKTQWNYFNVALSSGGDEQMDSIATSSERLLEVMDRITTMFEKAYAN